MFVNIIRRLKILCQRKQTHYLFIKVLESFFAFIASGCLLFAYWLLFWNIFEFGFRFFAFLLVK
jgi:hypothetical protein